MPSEIALLTTSFSNFWKVIFPYLLLIKAIFLQFWIFIIPFYLVRPLKFLLINCVCLAWVMEPSRKPIVLEVKVPPTVERPLRAMENVFNAIWGTYDPPGSWKEHYYEGKFLLGFTMEIIGTDGIPHMYLRMPSSNRKLIESAIYAQYPDVELIEVEDYVKDVPQDVPNKEWDLWGFDCQLVKDWVYPLKTYEQFFEERPEMSEEIKRVDPLSSLFEEIAKMQKGENLWIQIFAKPIGTDEIDYVKKAQTFVDKLVKRPEKAGIRTLIEDFWTLITTGELPKPKEEEKGFLPPEMKLTSGEREVVTAIERKASKICYNCFIRFVYIGERKVWFQSAKGFGVSFFSQFAARNLNGLKPMKKTITKVQAPDIFTERRKFVRKRDLFDKYRRRDTSFDPFPSPGSTFLLSSEELATLFHFPSQEVAPSAALRRVEMKKGAPPPQLPVE